MIRRGHPPHPLAGAVGAEEPDGADHVRSSPAAKPRRTTREGEEFGYVLSGTLKIKGDRSSAPRREHFRPTAAQAGQRGQGALPRWGFHAAAVLRN
ncbi:MAG: hypothetical protein ACLVJ6_02935 [Merdibacter sp.]